MTSTVMANNGTEATNATGRVESTPMIAHAVVAMVERATGPEAEAAAALQRKFLAKFHTLQIAILLSYSGLAVLCGLLIIYVRYHRNVALKGNAAAARKLVLPAFEPLLWILLATTAAYALLLTMALATGCFQQRLPTIVSEAFYAGRQFVFLMVVIYLLQKSVTVPALVRTVAITTVLSGYTLPLDLLLTALDPHTPAFKTTRHVIMSSARCLILGLYGYVFVWPPARASQRSLREYCLYAIVYGGLTFTYNQLLHDNSVDEGFCVLYATLLWACFCPLVIWRVLVADTDHWRGLGQRAVALQHLFRQKHHIDERISSQGLHVLIEMHRKFIIDFAYLELKHKIGTGTSAVVFNGILHSRTPVAIKVYTPTIFSEETVAEFSQEAALCGALHHPNIVTFHGMCVCPPTICLVSELCQGSLDTITGAIANQHQHPLRQQHLLNIAYMLDAARAVAYLHSFSPPFVHRDIKPENFLVDANNTVKLTDFGESRSLPKATTSSHVRINPSNFVDTKDIVMGSGASLHQHSVYRLSSVLSSPGAILDYSADAKLTRMTVKGTVDYMAPEIIQGRAGVAQYDEAADVYSLAITFWDVLYPGKEKYPAATSGNHLQIFDLVVDGSRPSFDGLVHPTLRSVIESAWQADPRRRPTAAKIVGVLEGIQAELLANFSIELGDEVDHDTYRNKHGEVVSRTFTARHAVDRMEECGYVINRPEAVRLGNALMDSGMLHHFRHDQPFDDSDEQYVFDEENIHLCQPILANRDDYDFDEDENVDLLVALPTPGVSRHSAAPPSRRGGSCPRSQKRSASSSNSGGIASARSQSSRSDKTLGGGGMCACRKLGQRIERPKTGGARKRFKKLRTKATPEDNHFLTARLLAAEANLGPTQLQLSTDFEAFDTVDQHFHPEKSGGRLT